MHSFPRPQELHLVAAREPERVLIDVRDGYVTVAGAARDYGVVVVGDPDLDPEGLVIDEAATARLRTERSAL